VSGPWNVGSDPAARPWSASTPVPRGDPSQQFAQQARTGSQPFARPYVEESSKGYAAATVSEPAKKRGGGALLAVAGLLAAGGIAFGVVKATEKSESPATSQAVTPSGGDSTGVTPGKPEPGSASVPGTDPTANAGAGSNGTTPAGSAVTPENGKATVAVPGEGSDSSMMTVKTETAKTEVKTGGNKVKSGSSKTGNKTGGTAKTTGGTATKRDDQTVKTGSTATPPVEVKKPEEKKPEEKKPPCDPFGAMHGCQK
jgi:hypothetical protein